MTVGGQRSIQWNCCSSYGHIEYIIVVRLAKVYINVGILLVMHILSLFDLSLNIMILSTANKFILNVSNLKR